MKKLLTLLLLLPILSSAQDMYLSANWKDSDGNAITEQNKAVLGDTITLNYLAVVNVSDIKYATFDGQWNNDNVTPIDGTFQFLLDGLNDPNIIAERYVYENKVWNQATQGDCGDLQVEKNAWDSGTPYADNEMFSIERIAIQASTSDLQSLDLTVFAKQDFIVNESAITSGGEYAFTMATAEYSTGTPVNGVKSNSCSFDVYAEPPTQYQIIVDFEIPSSVDATQLKGMIGKLTEIDGGEQYELVSEAPLAADGKITLTDIELDARYVVGLSIDDATFIDDIITVTDAYRSFKALNDTGINGTDLLFDTWEEFIADVNLNNSFNSEDVNLTLLKVVTGQAEEGTCIPYVYNGVTNTGCYGTVAYDSYGNRGAFGVEQPTQEQMDEMENTQSVIFTSVEAETTTVKSKQFAYWFHGDIDFSHSTSYAGTSGSGKSFNRSNKVVNSANVSVGSQIDGDKVIVDLNLTTSGLAGLQSKINYDTSVLQLEEIKFNTGNTVTNFNKTSGGQVIFGSLSLKGDNIETGKAYQLVFSMKQNVTNTTGLFYFYNTDAVRQSGEKLNLNIQ